MFSSFFLIIFVIVFCKTLEIWNVNICHVSCEIILILAEDQISDLIYSLCVKSQASIFSRLYIISVSSVFFFFHKDFSIHNRFNRSKVNLTFFAKSENFNIKCSTKRSIESYVLFKISLFNTVFFQSNSLLNFNLSDFDKFTNRIFWFFSFIKNFDFHNA